MQRSTKELFKNIGVPPSIHGYEYLGEAVEMVSKDSMLACNIIQGVYAKIAIRRGVSWKRVERCIRTAKEKCFDGLSTSQVRDIFGNAIDPRKGIPTNAHFIAALADLLEATHEQAN